LFLGDQIWDVASQTQLLQVWPDVGSIMALSKGEHLIACQRVKVGFGVWEFLPPVGVRTFLTQPLRTGSSLPQADVSANVRLLASTHPDGWRIWEVASGRVVAQEAETTRKGSTFQARFTADATHLMTVSRKGLDRWLVPHPDPSERARPVVAPAPEATVVGPTNRPHPGAHPPFVSPPLAGTGVAAGSFEHGSITVDGHFAVLAANDVAVVVDVARTNFSAIRLRSSDAEFSLSPDGRWLVTGRHNRPSQDVWEVRTGNHLLEITNTSFPACHFHPLSGELAVWNNTEVAFLEPGTWGETRRFAWPAGSLVYGLFPNSLSPDGRILWGYGTDLNISLLDGGNGRPVARLERPGGLWPNSMAFDARGQRAYLCSTRNVIVAFDLGILRRELGHLGLDWPEENPSAGFAPRRPVRSAPVSPEFL
jgi:hypothetical protein